MFTLSLFILCISMTSALIVQEDFTWTVQNGNGSISIPASVPGGIYSDLYTARVIDDILYRFNDVLTRWVADDNWTYTGEFYVTQEHLTHGVANLVLHGVDTVSFIELNDAPVGSTDNMFVRYVFDVKPHLKVGANTLKVSFVSPVAASRSRSAKHFTVPACVPEIYHGVCHVNQLRKMQASFGWDWGPAFPSVGIWKPLAIEYYDHAIIRSVTTHLKKIDQHWHLRIKAFLETSLMNDVWMGSLRADLKVEGGQRMSVAKQFDITVGRDGTCEAEFNMTISQNVVMPWWPNGYGDQPLYNLRVSVRTYASHSSEDHYKTLQIGFRTVEVVEKNASLVLANDTHASKGLTFYFEINGYPIFMKGSNWIPANVLPENGTDKRTVDYLLLSAKKAHMNMLRVWGGGVYESDHFYQRCDQLGILVWQDFMFGCSMYPVDHDFLSSVSKEVEQNVKRLQHHASIALWAGNNENEAALRGSWYGTLGLFDKYKTEYVKLYIRTMRPIVKKYDPGRRYITSSPTNGLESEAEGFIAVNPYDPHYGDIHCYDYQNDGWDMNIYPPTRFSSEYGVQSLPSLSTMRTATREADDYFVNSSYSVHRQHHESGYQQIEGQINKHLKLEKNDPKYFQKFVYYSQISQAMAMKAESEYNRQRQSDWYTMGSLYWQLNDVWQAPSWSGIEYGGKWKMMHYFAKSFFAPVLVSPRLLLSQDIDVYLINDRFVPIIDGHIKVETFSWNSLTPLETKVYPAQAEPLSSKKQFQEKFWNTENKESVFLRFSLEAEGVVSSPYNYVFPKPLNLIMGLRAPEIKVSVSKPSPSQSENLTTYWVDIQVDTVVLFLWLETDAIGGHFEDNGLIITEPYTRINYLNEAQLSTKQIESHITYSFYLN